MSVLFDASTDRATLTAGSPFTVGTDPINLIGWFYLTTDTDGSFELYVLADAVPVSGVEFGLVTDATGTGVQANVLGNVTTAYAVSLTTWYGFNLSRNAGVNGRLRIYPDSSSSTPLSDQTIAGSPDNFTTADTITVGDEGGRNGSALFKGANCKLITGLELSDAQTRVELDAFGVQTGSGNDRKCWKLTTINADTDGLNEIGGSGPNFSNSGATTDAGMPAQLSATPTLEQEGYRWLNDDGSESAATFAAAQDSGLSVTAGGKARLRDLINATLDPATGAYQKEYRKVGEGTWLPL